MRPSGKVTLHKPGRTALDAALAFVMTANQTAIADSLETADALPATVTTRFRNNV
jgi:hypothetical protein